MFCVREKRVKYIELKFVLCLKIVSEVRLFRCLIENERMPEAVELGWKYELVDVLPDFNDFHLNFAHSYESTDYCLM